MSSYIAPQYLYDRLIFPNGLPNGTGSILTLGSGNTVSTRTNAELISDLNLVTSNQLATKVNALENATGIGFSSGDSELAPYFYHAINGYRFLATQTWVNNQGFASNTSLNNYLPRTGGDLTGNLYILIPNGSNFNNNAHLILLSQNLDYSTIQFTIPSSNNGQIILSNANGYGTLDLQPFGGNVKVNGQKLWKQYDFALHKSIKTDKPFSVLTEGDQVQSVLTGGLLASDDYNDVSKIPYLGIHSKGLIQSEDGFQNRTYKVNQRNKIWNFGDSSTYGLSYYQGSYHALGEGMAFHFGDASDYKFYIKDNGNIYAKGRLTIGEGVFSSITTGNQLLNGYGDSLYLGNTSLPYVVFESTSNLKHYIPGSGVGVVWTSHNHNPFKNLRNVANVNEVTESGIYRQEVPTSGFNYTTTLNLNSADGRQQLTIERSGGGMKFRGTNSGSGDQGWSPWKTVWDDNNLQNPATETWCSNNFLTIHSNQNVTGIKTFTVSPKVPFAVEPDDAVPFGQAEEIAQTRVNDTFLEVIYKNSANDLIFDFSSYRNVRVVTITCKGNNFQNIRVENMPKSVTLKIMNSSQYLNPTIYFDGGTIVTSIGNTTWAEFYRDQDGDIFKNNVNGTNII